MMGKKNERFQMRNLKIVASTSIVVLPIQFKPFEVFGGTRSSSIVNSTVPIIMKCASYIYIFVAWIGPKLTKNSIQYHGINNKEEEKEATIYFL